MSEITLSFGSNLGDKEANILKAYKLLEERLGHRLNTSDFYYSTAWGFQSDNLFVNTCAVFSTDKNPFECLKIVNAIEEELGRVRSGMAGYEDRMIDIDIIFYDDLHLDTEKLKIPHPLWQVRDFVKIPLSQINKIPKTADITI